VHNGNLESRSDHVFSIENLSVANRLLRKFGGRDYTDEGQRCINNRGQNSVRIDNLGVILGVIA